MENIEEDIRKRKLTKRVQNIWGIKNNIIGYSLIVAVIVLGVQNGYRSTAHFAVFCWAAAIYFFSKYIYYPLFTNKKHHPMSEFKKLFAFEYFTSFLGCGNVLFGRFDSSCYSFLSIMYIPLIPTGRYHFFDNRKMIQIDSLSTQKGKQGCYHCWIFKRFDWVELLYIYLKNWSFAVMVITVLDVIIPLLLNPYMGGN